jgi:hypothetical protein
MFNDMNRRMKKVVAEAQRITRDNGEYGAELVRDTVETSGTVKTGKRGRIETGAMLESVDSDYKEIPGGAEATYGFLNPPEYTKYQEGGTQYIEGMFAIDDAAGNVDVDYIKDLRAMLSKEW